MVAGVYFPAKFEFHVTRQAREKYQFDKTLFSTSGNIILANFRSAREFADKINFQRDLIQHPDKTVRASEINAMGLIDEILHALVEFYREDFNPQVMENALYTLQNQLGEDEIQQLLRKFLQLFPPTRVYQGLISEEEYLAGETEGLSNLLITLEELILLWTANQNPAFEPFFELFDDSELVEKTVYSRAFSVLYDFFETQPPLEDLNLIDILLQPARTSPNSLYGQLEFLIRRWQKVIGKRFLLRILGSLDFIKEETQKLFGLTGGSGDAVVYEFDLAALEPEKFSPDKDWMPSLVLLAKNTYVWLDQLSKQYQREIRRLDQIPDEELDRLRSAGFSGLWLIGLWERSSASQRIKQLCGNPEAVASAYSLYDYAIANDLGGEDAYQQLRQRAWQRGIRLAADMVPNHVGIYSRWVIEHPDWFISLNYSPYPNYSFNGPDLSEDSRVGIFLEDHYYSRGDAAVVFKRRDNWTGDERYIYHGNDGTSMPWNDTAQLNYLLPEVREAVIQTILEVARKFPVIRFDAAMTLAKKHYQRLWFPEPGSGGDIPTRSEYGLTKEQFDAAMPVEFWREVVDRVAKEVPDTLLLAEAFWLMEGYFVRTLGMHRVYNSAFMNMMRDEKNAEYRQVIKNTLEFDPEILKRYVNFMNNPDERTAVDQFGKGDKYFGVAAMMATMPGLPMFGHGQIEGYTEKYGMEYRKAYWEEKPDPYLVERHFREISPLLHRRFAFAGVENFLLYDFYTVDGYVNEDVFAFSNETFGQRSLFIYHNRFADTRGWIHTSAAYAVKLGEAKELRQKSLAEGLYLDADSQKFTIFKDQRSRLEYIRNNQEIAEKGLYFDLGAYDYHVFINFREVYDSEGHYRQLADSLGGRGVGDINEALRELFLQNVHVPLRELLNPGQILWIIENARNLDGDEKSQETIQVVLNQVEEKGRTLYSAVKDFSGGEKEAGPLAAGLKSEIGVALKYFGQREDASTHPNADLKKALELIRQGLSTGQHTEWVTILGWSILHRLGEIQPKGVDAGSQTATNFAYDWLDEWLLKKRLRQVYYELGCPDQHVDKSVALLSLLVKYRDWYKVKFKGKQKSLEFATLLLADSEVEKFLGVNQYEEVLWFKKEAMESLLWGLLSIAAMALLGENGKAEARQKQFLTSWNIIRELQTGLKYSDFQVDKFIKSLGSPRRKVVKQGT
jgi:glycosidase